MTKGDELKVDNDFKQAFNEGYEIASVLGLKSDELQEINGSQIRMMAIKAGIEQFEKDRETGITKDIRKEIDLDALPKFNPGPEKDLDKGKDIDLEM